MNCANAAKLFGPAARVVSAACSGREPVRGAAAVVLDDARGHHRAAAIPARSALGDLQLGDLSESTGRARPSRRTGPCRWPMLSIRAAAPPLMKLAICAPNSSTLPASSSTVVIADPPHRDRIAQIITQARRRPDPDAARPALRYKSRKSVDPVTEQAVGARDVEHIRSAFEPVEQPRQREDDGSGTAVRGRSRAATRRRVGRCPSRTGRERSRFTSVGEELRLDGEGGVRGCTLELVLVSIGQLHDALRSPARWNPPARTPIPFTGT